MHLRQNSAEIERSRLVWFKPNNESRYATHYTNLKDRSETYVQYEKDEVRARYLRVT